MNDLAEKQEQPIAVTENGSGGMLALIERAATNPDVDVEKMERLYEMYSKMEAQRANQAYNEAMTAAQSEMGRISADANNPQTKSKYASYGKLDKVLRPIYTKHGFSISFDTGDTEKADILLVLAHVSHNAGHTRTYKAPMDISGKGAKGGDVMTKTHAAGSAMTYGMRYLLKLIFNVAIGEEDNDGNDDVERISEKQVADLKALINEVGGDAEEALLGWAGIGRIEDLPADKYKKAVQGVEKRR